MNQNGRLLNYDFCGNRNGSFFVRCNLNLMKNRNLIRKNFQNFYRFFLFQHIRMQDNRLQKSGKIRLFRIEGNGQQKKIYRIFYKSGHFEQLLRHSFHKRI